VQKLAEHNETQKERIMRILKVSEEEADEILEYDKRIDKGERVEYDLSPELEKMAKKFANVTTHKKPMVLDTKPRERKADDVKISLIESLFNHLNGNENIKCENVTITNKSKTISFVLNGETYEIDLKRKSTPK
jgi:uncharacterized protein Yka (UPF0111/DUF47 family)